MLAKSGDEVSGAELFNGTPVNKGSSGKAFIDHDQPVAHLSKGRQVGGSADGVDAGDRHLAAVLVNAAAHFADHGGRFDLAVFLGRLIEQLVGVGNDECRGTVLLSQPGDHLAEDDGFAGRGG